MTYQLPEKLIASAPIAIAVVEGPEFRFAQANPAYGALASQEEASLIGRTLAEVCPETSACGCQRVIQQVFNTGQRLRQEELEVDNSPGHEPTWWNVEHVPLEDEAGRVQAVLIMAQEVTEQVRARHRAEEQAAALRESEQRAQLATEAANAGTWYLDVPTGAFFAADQALELHGLPAGTRLTVADALAAIHPNDRDAVSSQLKQTLEEGGPYEVEYRALWPDGTVRWLASKARLHPGPHGPRLLGLVQDVTQRRQAEAQVRQLATIVEGSSDFIGVAGLDHCGIYLNRAGQALVGLNSNDEVRARKIEEYLFPEDLPFMHQTVLPTVVREGRWKGEFRFRHFQTGEPIAVYWDVYRIDDPHTGQPWCMATVTRDIRAQKSAKEALRKSQRFLQRVAEINPAVLYLFDVAERRAVSLTREMPAVLGYSREQLDAMGQHQPEALMHPEDAARLPAHFARLAAAPDDTAIPIEYRMRHADGSWRWFFARDAVFQRDAAGGVKQLLGAALDVTELKRAEESLRESEELLRLAEQAAGVGSFERNIAEGRTRWSPEMADIYGITPETFAGTEEAWLEMLHPDDRPRIEAHIAEMVAQHNPQFHCEFRIVRPDGQVRWLEARSRMTYDAQGNPLRVIGVNVDITDRKQAEAKIRQLATVTEYSNDFIGIAGLDHQGWYVNRAGQALVGVQGDAVRATLLEQYFFPEDFPFVFQAVLPTVLREGRWTGEFRFRHFQTGEPIAMSGDVFTIEDPDSGQPIGIATVSRDIRQQKAAEQALRESEERFRLATEATNGIVYDWDLTTGLTWRSAKMVDIVGYRPEEAPAANDWWRSLIHPDDLATSDPTVFAPDVPLRTVEYRVRHKDGHYVWVWDTARIVRDPQGRPLHVVGCTLSIDDRKRAEQALRESEERFRLGTEALSGVVYDLDLTTDTIQRSQGMLELIGYRPDELPLEASWWLTRVHPEDLDQLNRQWEATLAAREPVFSGTYRIRHRDGHYLWVWDRGRILYHPEGQPGRMVGTTVSIDDQKRAEEALKRLNETLEQRIVERTAIAEHRARQLRVLAAELSLAEEQERRRLAKILHDHLQQLLVAARIKVALVRRRVDDDKLQRTLQQIDEVLDQSITESRSLTVELSPPVLYDAGLAAGFEWLARQVEEKHGLRVEIHAGAAAEPTDEATRVLLFQAVRELLLNVVKHAQTDLAQVTVVPLDDNRLQLVVSDRGVGFDQSRVEARGPAGGFGLFSIRERLELIGGHLEVDSSPGQGTRMTLTVSRGRPLPVRRAPATLPPQAREPEAVRPRHKVAGPPSPPKTRVLLADDHAIVREGLAGLLRDHSEIEVVGEAGSGEQAVEVALQTRPDVILMDVTMPGLNGIEATRQIRNALPEVRVIGLSMHEEADMAAAMHRAGAVAYLRKDTPSENLVATILAQRPTLAEV